MVAVALMVDADRGSGNQRKAIYYPEESEKAGEGVRPLVASTVSERYTEISRIMGIYISPFGAYGVLGKANDEYLGNVESGLRSRVRSADTNSKCIYVPRKRRYAH